MGDDMDRNCSVPGCVRESESKGMCSKHYQRARNGKPLISDAERYPNECRVDGCKNSPRTHGYCYAHYMKWHRYGTPTPEWAPTWDDIVGKQYGTLTVVERVPGAWRCSCTCGGERTASTGELNRTGDENTCGDRTAHRAADPGYRSMHQRLKADFGPAKAHTCVECGNQAAHWSYNHDDPDERTWDDPRSGSLIAYSTSAIHYSPRCVPCHKRFDLDKLTGTPQSVVGP